MVRIQYTIIFVSDMSRSISFYRDVVGATLRFESPEWTEFDTGGATLALHKGEPRIDPGKKPDQTIAGHCQPGFAVEDMDAFHARMIENKVVVVREPTQEFGVRIAQYLDPDGLIFSVSDAQHAA